MKEENTPSLRIAGSEKQRCVQERYTEYIKVRDLTQDKSKKSKCPAKHPGLAAPVLTRCVPLGRIIGLTKLIVITIIKGKLFTVVSEGCVSEGIKYVSG